MVQIAAAIWTIEIFEHVQWFEPARPTPKKRQRHDKGIYSVGDWKLVEVYRSLILQTVAVQETSGGSR